MDAAGPAAGPEGRGGGFFLLASRQHGLVTCDQMAKLGVSEPALRRLVARRMLDRIGPSVYRVTAAPESWKQRVLAATLSNPHSLASHRTAAALWQLDGFP